MKERPPPGGLPLFLPSALLMAVGGTTSHNRTVEMYFTSRECQPVMCLLFLFLFQLLFGMCNLFGLLLQLSKTVIKTEAVYMGGKFTLASVLKLCSVRTSF